MTRAIAAQTATTATASALLPDGDAKVVVEADGRHQDTVDGGPDIVSVDGSGKTWCLLMNPPVGGMPAKASRKISIPAEPSARFDSPAQS